MQTIAAWYLIATMAGAPGRLLTPPSTDWAAVMALSPGTDVSVTYPNGQRAMGRVKQVTADEIVVRRKGHAEVIRREDIVSLARLEPDGRTRRRAILTFAMIGGVVATVFAVFGIAAHDENHSAGSAEIAVVLAGTGIGAWIGSATRPRQAYKEVPIYVRL